MKVEDKLIHRPEAVQPKARTLFGVITLVAWLGYLYLWLPLVTLLLWLAGSYTAFLRLVDEPPAVDTTMLLQLLMIAAGCALLLTGWAEYNRLRFQGKDRRSQAPQVGERDVAAALGASETVAERLRTARSIVIVMDEQAVPRAVRELAALGPR